MDPLVRQAQQPRGVSCAHLQAPSAQDPHGLSSRTCCASVLFVGLLAKSRVRPNRPCGGSRQLHVVHYGGRAGIVDEQFQRLSDAAPSLVNGAALCVAAAYPAHRGEPPARLVSLVSHAIRPHGFFNQPFPRPASARGEMRASYGEVAEAAVSAAVTRSG